MLLSPATHQATGFLVILGVWWNPMLDPANRRKGVLVRGIHQAEEALLKFEAFARIREKRLGLHCSTLDELIMKSRSLGKTSILSLRSRSGKETSEHTHTGIPSMLKILVKKTHTYNDLECCPLQHAQTTGCR